MTTQKSTQKLIGIISGYIEEANVLIAQLRKFTLVSWRFAPSKDDDKIKRFINITNYLSEEVHMMDAKMNTAYSIVEMYHDCNLVSSEDAKIINNNLDDIIKDYRARYNVFIEDIDKHVPDWKTKCFEQSMGDN